MAFYSVYSVLRHFTLFNLLYRILSYFVTFYHFLLAKIPENDQEWPEMAKNDYESLQKFAEVHESQCSLQTKREKVKLAKFIAGQRSLKASYDTSG